MGRHAAFLGLTFAGLAAFAVFAGWAFFEGTALNGGWRSLGPILPYVIGGGVLAFALACFLIWLAFYSANNGYDDRIDLDGP